MFFSHYVLIPIGESTSLGRDLCVLGAHVAGEAAAYEVFNAVR